MRAFILALALMTGPTTAQDVAAPLPPDGGLGGGSDVSFAQNEAFVATISTVLQTPAAQKTAVDLAMTRLQVPAALRAAVTEHLTQLMADRVAQAGIAKELAALFDSMGMTPLNPDVIARMAGDQVLIWGEGWVADGLVRLPAADQAAGLALRLRLARDAGAQDCADYLSDAQDDGATRRMQMQIMATWQATDASAALALMRRAILAELSATGDRPDLTFAELSRVDQAAGLAITAAIDATDDPARVYAAFGFADQATPDDICAARLTMLQAVQAMTGPEAGLALRYVTQYGLGG